METSKSFNKKEQLSTNDESYAFWLESERYKEFKSTDTIYSLTHRSPDNAHNRIDVINPVIPHERILISIGSSIKSERIIQNKYPGIALKRKSLINLNHPPNHPEVRVYDIPEGARPLTDTLLRSPYSFEYSKRLASDAGSFVKKLNILDRNIFGIDIDSLAIAPNESGVNDNVKFLIVPPLDDPYKPRVGIDVEERIVNAAENLPYELIQSFIEGYRGHND